MNQSTADKYEISFINKMLDIKGYPIFFRKVVSTNNIHLTDFLNYINLIDIEEYYIPEIDKVLNGIEPEFETASDSATIIINPISAIFLIDGVGIDYPKIPTGDLKEILIGWKDYLKS